MTSAELSKAACLLRQGGVVAHACEGVWGLACDPWNESAVQKILSIKQRESAKGLIVIAHDASEFSLEVDELDFQRRKEVTKSWPGHTTWILKSDRFPEAVTGGRGTIAARVPDHEQARALCESFGGPLISTSANVSETEPARTEEQVRLTVGASVDFVLPGQIGEADGPSRIRDATSGATFR